MSASPMFVVNDPEVSAEVMISGEAPPYNSSSHNTFEGGRQTSTQGPPVDGEAAVPVESLIPPCVIHATDRTTTSATYGYDIANMSKRPWAEPGAKMSDYFNYGFSEKTWRLYCSIQRDGESSLLAQAEKTLERLGHSASGVESGSFDQRGGVPHGGGFDGHDGRGHQRPYFHGGDARVGGGGGGGGYHSNFKTRMCQRFIEGHCSKGNLCNYAHGASELRPAPGEAHHSMQPNPMEGGGGGGYYGGPPSRTHQGAPSSMGMAPYRGPPGAMPPPMMGILPSGAYQGRHHGERGDYGGPKRPRGDGHGDGMDR